MFLICVRAGVQELCGQHRVEAAPPGFLCSETPRRVDPMKLVSVETPEKSVCKMTFSASPEELEAASNAVYERTRASYTIRGFKKGEADRAQIEADRGEHTFWYDAINDLMDKDVPALYDVYFVDFDRTRSRTRKCKIIIMGE